VSRHVLAQPTTAPHREGPAGSSLILTVVAGQPIVGEIRQLASASESPLTLAAATPNPSWEQAHFA
jgi:hypothetical protein